MMRKTYVMQDALAVYPPQSRRVLSSSEKRWRPEPRIRRHHLVGSKEQRIFSRLCNSSSELLGCPWCSKRIGSSVAIPTHFSGSDVSAPPPSPQCCRIHWACQQTNRQQCRLALRTLCDHRHQAKPAYPARKAVRVVYQPDPTLQKIRSDIKSNLRTQSPLSTVVLRWHIKKSDPGYTLDEVYAELRKYGNVVDMVRTSEVSVRATLAQLDDACRAVASRYIGRDSNPLFVLWFHRTMANKSFHLWQRHLHVYVDPFT
ncbi:uncharacterized protein [Diadema setosum]|uniref:uncharacterized protein n=1 Tax=Diadema setosum TaxID=31175 RepID=UPI003B3A2440